MTAKRALWAVEVAGGEPVEAWVVACDVDARDGRGTFVLTADVAQARLFDTASEALDYWQRQSTVVPLRPDGKPNRPLTALTVEVKRVNA